MAASHPRRRRTGDSTGAPQIIPGPPISATYAINAVDFPGLNFGPGQRPSLSVNLIEPNTEFEDYVTNLQLLFSKVITTGNVRTRVYMDANNIFNRAQVTRRNQFYGGGGVRSRDFLRILGIEPGRVLSFGLQAT